MVKNFMQEKNPRAPAILRTAADMRAWHHAQKQAGARIAFVPTMGALHDGHIALVTAGRAAADAVVASIFVNPTQFGPGEDFSAYPRTWDADLEKLAAAGCDAIFYPEAATMYPDGFATSIRITGITEPLEGAHRPGHFDGVATVVAKLLLLVLPDVALFGEKDWQQLQLIRRLVADLNIPVTVTGVPTVRDENGLALSSRNAYLSADEYKIALRLNETLFAMAEQLRAGMAVAAVEQWGMEQLRAAGFGPVDYITVRHAHTLQPPVPGDGPLRILAAARCGPARLIDNIAV